MEMRARAETGMSRDLTPPIPPLAASLHDSFLLSHCSSCFLPIPAPHAASAAPIDGGHIEPDASSPPCCSGGGATVRYCSLECRDADLDAHASSGECHLLRLARLHHSRLSAWRNDDTADLRAAIRLMHSLEKLGFLPSPLAGAGRIGGLLAGNREQLEEDGELWEGVREGGALISDARIRRLLRGGVEDGCDGGDGGGEAEEAVLWAVVTNAVEVQVDEGRAIGIAVYGPRFSWFNHSCAPNACYRFELRGSECFQSAGSRLLVYPAATGPEDDMMATWMLDEREQSQGLCKYGPRIVVRTIRPINQGEEVCIAYTDLLQPRALRRSDLLSKYGFICCCTRCSAYPEMYVDHILCETAFSLDTPNVNSCHRHQKDKETEESADVLDQFVMEYLSIGDPEACCSYIETMLSEGFSVEWLQPADSSSTRSKLQPLHHISFKAYIILASIYRMRACDLETSSCGRDGVPKVFDMNRAAAAYSLLLAGATNHLFLSNLSLMATTALFWVSAGESFLVLVKSLIHRPDVKWVNLSEFSIIFGNARGILSCTDNSSLPWYEFNATSLSFLHCVSRISSKVWPFVISGIQCLSEVKIPVDYSWLGKKNLSHQVLVIEGVSAGVHHSGNEERNCIGCRCEAKMHVEEDSRNLYQLAIHCLVYGGFLTTICYGYQSYWVDHIRKLLCGEAGK